MQALKRIVYVKTALAQKTHSVKNIYIMHNPKSFFDSIKASKEQQNMMVVPVVSI